MTTPTTSTLDKVETGIYADQILKCKDKKMDTSNEVDMITSNQQSSPPKESTGEKSVHADPASKDNGGSARHESPEPPTQRLYGIPTAPTYRPTEEEFRDPLGYIQKIAPEGSRHGIIKIVPPENWKPTFAIDPTKFQFKTRRQELNSLEGGSRARSNYLDQLSRFHRQNGLILNQFPSVDKRPVDLFFFKKAIEAKGGFEMICQQKKWSEIGRELGYGGKITSALSTSLKNCYQKYVLPYEEYLRGAKPGVQAQLKSEREKEYGKPAVSTPRTSPNGKITPSADVKNEKSTMQMSTRMEDADDSIMRNTNSSGFTGVASFTPVNGVSTPPADKHVSGSKLSSDANGSKRLSSDIDGMALDLIDDRQHKRAKLDGIPNVMGSQMHQPRQSSVGRSTRERSSATRPEDMCNVCKRSGKSGEILLCDGCESRYHLSCLETPPVKMPEDGWNCPKCLVGTGDFGFTEGGTYLLDEFQAKADKFRATYFDERLRKNPKPVSEDEVEAEFWRLVEDADQTVEVEYGADIHSTTHGSAFPTFEKQPKNPYSSDPWNLNVLPFYGDGLFKYIKSNISGMTVPWLYVGMLFSTFCWHNEDHYTYSANYHHRGATKTWYGIPSSDADKFEETMRKAVPELFETQPDLLFQLVTLLPPGKLKEAGVQVYAVDQRAGEFVITFPQAYHAGFNHGFNFNEAVNFAPPEWAPFGEVGVNRLRVYRRQPCFSHDELIFTAAGRDTSIKTAKWLGPAMESILERELIKRQIFFTHERPPHAPVAEYRGLRYLHIPEAELGNLEEDEYICTYCKSDAYLSRYVCIKTGKVLCLIHAGWYKCCDDDIEERYSCPKKDHIVYHRFTDEALKEAVHKVSDKARAPQIWTAKLDALLESGPRPQLKVLRALVHEGEKIPSELPRMAEFKKFVNKCNEWVEDATSYTSRKQSRRKSDMPGRKSFATKLEVEDRGLDNIRRLLVQADDLGFDCPELDTLRLRAEEIESFQHEVRDAIHSNRIYSKSECEELCNRGKVYNVDIPEIEALHRQIDRLEWREEAHENRKNAMKKSQIAEIIERAKALDLNENDIDMHYYHDLLQRGETWNTKATELMQGETISVPQLEGLVLFGAQLPVDEDLMQRVQSLVQKQREVTEQIFSLCERSQNNDFRKRPKYLEARDIFESLITVVNKPSGWAEIERNQKRHEDWMRKGKKLFGKTNAPLHILQQHMDIVRERNEACFNVVDKPGTPVEPRSRQNTPAVKEDGMPTGRPEGTLYCICRKSEAGMMIECEICHEWYHGKCLKLARGKVKDDDKYTCPICDWRQKIPRDAARPKLEDLIGWYEEMDKLPYQPEEEKSLRGMIETAQTFRDFVQPILTPILTTIEEVEIMRFYLRKIEGADLLLAHETNILRQELHKWFPVSEDAPPMIEVSGSTRKPRPTKIQKLMAQFGVDNPDDLPEEHRIKPLKKKEKIEPKIRKKGKFRPPSEERKNGSNHPNLSVNTTREKDDEDQLDMSYDQSGIDDSLGTINKPMNIDPALLSAESVNEEMMNNVQMAKDALNGAGFVNDLHGHGKEM